MCLCVCGVKSSGGGGEDRYRGREKEMENTHFCYNTRLQWIRQSIRSAQTLHAMRGSVTLNWKLNNNFNRSIRWHLSLTFGDGCSILLVKSSVSFESLNTVLNSSRISPWMNTFPDFEELTLNITSLTACLLIKMTVPEVNEVLELVGCIQCDPLSEHALWRWWHIGKVVRDWEDAYDIALGIEQSLWYSRFKFAPF